MYRIKNSLIKSFESDDREIAVRCTFNDSFIVDGEYIKKIEITDVISGDTTLSLGNTCSNQLKLDMYLPEEFIGLGNAKIKAELGIIVGENVEYVPMGIFFVDSFKTNSDFKSVSIIAYDAMQKISELGDTYKCKIPTSKTYVSPVDVIKDVAAQAGLNTELSAGGVTKKEQYSENGVAIKHSGINVEESNIDIGINEPLLIPAGTSDIDIKCFTDAENAGNLTVVYYDDYAMKSIYSYKTYGGLAFGETFDPETGEQWLDCMPDIPVTNKDLYMAFSFKTNEFTTVPETNFIVEVEYKYAPYVNTASFLKLSDIKSMSVSPRNMLGYMAGLLGGNAKIDRNGYVTVKSLDITGYGISGDMQFMNGLTKNITFELKPTYLTSGVQNDDGTSQIVTVGAGTFGFNFSNPFFYQYQNTIFNTNVAEEVLGIYQNKISFLTGSVNYRCNPALESGDIVLVEDKLGDYYSFLIKSQTISISGGLKSVLNCDIDTATKPDFISAPRNKTLSQSFGDFDRMYQSIISKLTGNQGGYVKFVYDEYGKMRAIAIPESDIDVSWNSEAGKVVSENNVPIWVWSNSGFSYTPDGGLNYNVAINMDGEIYAEQLVGKLSRYVELQAELGTIGGWTIDDISMYSDYTDSNGNTYRAYIQNASAAGTESWVFSTQQKSGDGFVGNFLVKVNGDTYVPRLYDDYGRTLIAYNNNDNFFVFGLGAYQKDYDAYYEGKNVILRSKNNGNVVIQREGTTIFDIGRWTTTIMDSTANRDCIMSRGGLVISANDGSNAMYLQGSTINSLNHFVARSTSTFVGQATFSSTLKATNGITVDGSNYLNFSKSNNGVWVDGGNSNLFLEGSSYVKSNTEFRLVFASSSGTIPLAVGTNGQVTTSTSSERYKENITEELEDWLNPEKLYDLPVVQYNYKNEYQDIELVSGTQIGVTAESVHNCYPNACIYNKEGQPESWQERIMIPAMLKLIQEQKKEIEQLKVEQSKYNERLNILENKLKEEQN